MDEQIEHAAAAVHQAYLATCDRLGWPVKPENNVDYAELSEESKELDRVTAQAAIDALGHSNCVDPDHYRKVWQQEREARERAERAASEGVADDG